MIDMRRAFVWSWDLRPYPFFPNKAALWSDGVNYARGHWINGRTSGRTLESVVREICFRAGMSLETFDTSRFYGFVRGYEVDSVSDARASLQPLMLRHGFDAIEREGVLHFRMRDGQRPIALDLSQLAVSADVDGAMEQTRDAQAEVSGRVRVRFVQADGDFDILAEEAVLADESTHAVATTDLNMALTRSEGRQLAERWLTEARVSRDSLKLALRPSKLSLGAGDVIELPADQNEGPARYRIDRVEQTEIQLIEAVRIEPAVYDLAPLPDELASLRPFVAPTPVNPLFLDLPLMTGYEMAHAPHLAVSAQPWPGSVAVYQSSSDEGYALNTVLPTRSVIGVTTTDLAQACSGRIDTRQVLEVRLLSGTLQSVTQEALLSGANIAAIGDGSSDQWELFQFGEAELVSDGVYILRNRLRGQLGKDALMPTVWPAGSKFVLMNGIPQQLELSRNLRRVAQHFRIGPAQRGVDDPSYQHLVEAFDGNGLRPLSPVHLQADQAANGDVALSWIRRTRVDGDSWDAPEVPLGEEAELYQIRILENGQLVREETVDTSSWVYAASLVGSDGVTGSFEVSVAQLSAVYGAGLAALVSVAV